MDQPLSAQSPCVNLADLAYRRAAVEELLDLRWRVLRAGLPFDAARFEGDHEPATRHFGAFAGAAAVACASFVFNAWEGQPAWQLRGMATDPRCRGLGVGQSLLAHAAAALAGESPVRLFWCNARVPALGFYQRQGWQVASDLFDIETAGPHRKMVKRA